MVSNGCIMVMDGFQWFTMVMVVVFNGYWWLVIFMDGFFQWLYSGTPLNDHP